MRLTDAVFARMVVDIRSLLDAMPSELKADMSQKEEDLIKACENALRFYGGAPYAIVPDNLKSAVTRSDRNEPVINPDFEAFAEHYGCAVVPARMRHPRDKALVENAVKLMYRSVYVDLEGMVFHDL